MFDEFKERSILAIALDGTLLQGNLRIMTPDRFSVQQFTGLFDCRKTGIYEGDIVRIEDTNGSALRGTIEYSGACFIIRTMDGSAHSLNDTAPLYVKILGNICENPDLISQES